MGKNKRKHPQIEEILARPWCYYCERDFDDLKILISHQKAKHYKCDRCGRRLNTAGGLSVHMTQVHKETLTVIENALPNRSGLENEIFGMEGIPEEIVQSHNQRVLQQFAQAEADRRATSGNTGPDGAGGQAKKPKFETPSDLKKRLAEHKAKKAAEEANGQGSGQNTPTTATNNAPSPGGFGNQPAQSYPQHSQAPPGAPPNAAAFSPYPQPYGPPPQPGPQGPPQFQPPPHQQPPTFHQQQQPPHFQSQMPPQPGFGPAGMPQYPNNQQFAPPQQYQPPGGPGFQPHFQNGPPPQFQGGPHPYQNGPPHFQNGPSPFQNSPPHHFGPGSPPPFQQSQFQPPRNNTPPHHKGMPARPPSLPSAPGLPVRPTFGAPPVNAQELQQMHQGQFKPPQKPQENSFNPPHQQNTVAPAPAKSQSPQEQNAGTSLDELVSGAARAADNASTATKAKAAEQKPADAPEDRKGKKEKDKSMKLIYSDNEVSPEEKMAQMPRYAFVRPV